MQFPWPTPDTACGPAVRLFVRERVWIAAVKRTLHARRVPHCSRPLRIEVLPPAGEEPPPAGPDTTLDLLEVGPADLLPLASRLAHRRTTPGDRPVVVLLERGSFGQDDALAACRLLREAGVRHALTSPRQTAELVPLVQRFYRHATSAERDPLDDLPLRCWGPAWQRGA